MKTLTVLVLCALLAACAEAPKAPTVDKPVTAAAKATPPPADTTRAQKIDNELRWANQQEFDRAKRTCEQLGSCFEYKRILEEMKKQDAPAPVVTPPVEVRAPAEPAPAAEPASVADEFLLAESKLGARYTLLKGSVHMLADNRVSGEVKTYDYEGTRAATFTAACGSKEGGAYQWGDKGGFWVYGGDKVGDLIGYQLCQVRKAIAKRSS